MLRAKCFYSCLSVVVLLVAATAVQADVTYSSTVLANNPIGYWRMGGTGLTTAYDSSGNANNGTAGVGAALGAVSPGALPNDVSKAATFGGAASTSCVSIDNGSPFNFDTTDPFTLEAWVKSTDARTMQGVVAKYASGTCGYFMALYNPTGTSTGGELAIQLQSSASAYSYAFTDGKNLADGNWHYVAAAYNGGGSSAGLSLFVDGSAVVAPTAGDGDTLGSIQNTGLLDIGQRDSGSVLADKVFKGSIDEVAVYGSVLSGTDIAAHWAARNDIGLTPDPVPEPSTVVFLTTGLLGLLAYAWRKRK
jgi:hypothetical protein